MIRPDVAAPTSKPRLSRACLGLDLAAFVTCIALAGCASPGELFGAPGKSNPFREPGMSIESARDAVTPGRSTKADVIAALGEATVVRFDSGFEVWAYRGKPPGGAELVVLFAPSGTVTKMRIRPAYRQGSTGAE